ncbi:uncharacterized protein BCR38DRAFT_73957 [Pseudomassariella vexata]|uniref:Rhodopsin domain-containing protein n=1 Tax=Pseudomassariella vexata TaxID=1141098 RepID=A0A1Y2DGY3_9PEZI|nr:uncharacterized protein BCR38DRAFT_73957 [Pseudomassariella vexata]ORY58510.1 hypothetical protein BCR38DRAFT_73957 [Pseudomassariella vexata]
MNIDGLRQSADDALNHQGTYIGFIYCCYDLMATSGYFIHQWDIRLGDLIGISYILHIGGVFYSVTLPLLKAAILLEWVHIFVPMRTRNAFWWICHAVVVVQLMLLVASVLALCFTCIPYEKIWDFTIPGKCLDKSKVEISSASIHLASDAIILCLPQRVIWGLNMPIKRRLGVSVIFSLGVLACTSAAFRLAVTVSYSTANDAIYSVASVILWALAEMTCGFMVICLPTAPKLLVETGTLARLKAALRSWTSMRIGSGASSKKSHTNPGQSSSRVSMPKSPGPGTLYQKIDEDGVPLAKLDRSGSASESTEGLREYPNRPVATIVRTTQFVTREDHVDDVGGNDDFHRQHPWHDK